jgi:hypothetical protein
MTPAERETLEALAESREGDTHDLDCSGETRAADLARREAAAIRSALATIDALTASHAEAGREIERLRAEVETLTAEREELEADLGSQRSRVVGLVSRITGKPGDLSNESVGEACRTARALRLELAELSRRVCGQDAPLHHALRCADETAAEVADLRIQAERTYACHICGKRLTPGGGSIVVVADDDCRCAAEVADLRARAIPTDMLTLVAIDHGPSAATIGYVAGDPDPSTRWQCWTPTQRSGHPTLAAAIDAAAKESP